VEKPLAGQLFKLGTVWPAQLKLKVELYVYGGPNLYLIAGLFNMILIPDCRMCKH